MLYSVPCNEEVFPLSPWLIGISFIGATTQSKLFLINSHPRMRPIFGKRKNGPEANAGRQAKSRDCHADDKVMTGFLIGGLPNALTYKGRLLVEVNTDSLRIKLPRTRASG